MGIMGFLAIVNAYTMRISLSVAITEMVVSINSTDYDNEGSCPFPEDGSSDSGAVTVSPFTSDSHPNLTIFYLRIQIFYMIGIQLPKV